MPPQDEKNCHSELHAQGKVLQKQRQRKSPSDTQLGQNRQRHTRRQRRPRPEAAPTEGLGHAQQRDGPFASLCASRSGHTEARPRTMTARRSGQKQKQTRETVVLYATCYGITQRVWEPQDTRSK